MKNFIFFFKYKSYISKGGQWNENNLKEIYIIQQEGIFIKEIELFSYYYYYVK